MDKHFYTVTIDWTSGRQGVLCSPEVSTSLGDQACLSIATPPQFPQGVAGFWSPEHLFTASVGSCFLTTFLAIAENSKLPFTAFRCRATGLLEAVEGKLIMTEIALAAEVEITAEENREKAVRVLQKSEKACLISNSIRSKVTMIPTITVKIQTADAVS